MIILLTFPFFSSFYLHQSANGRYLQIVLFVYRFHTFSNKSSIKRMLYYECAFHICLLVCNRFACSHKEEIWNWNFLFREGIKKNKVEQEHSQPVTQRLIGRLHGRINFYFKIPVFLCQESHNLWKASLCVFLILSQSSAILLLFNFAFLPKKCP